MLSRREVTSSNFVCKTAESREMGKYYIQTHKLRKILILETYFVVNVPMLKSTRETELY